MTSERVKVELVDNKLKLNSVGVAADLNIGEGSEIHDILEVIDKEIKTLKEIEPLPSDFLKAAELCAFSAFVKDIGGSFTCVKVEEHRMFSSDRTRFSCYEMDLVMAEMMFKAPVVTHMLNHELKLYSVTKSWIHFFEAKDGLVFSVRKYSGKYPTNEIIEITEASKAKVVSKIVLPDEVLQALGFLNIFTEGQEQKHCQVTAKGGMLSIQVSGTKGTVTKKLKVETKKEFTFGINPVLLGEILKRGMKTLEVSESDKTPMAFFRSKNFTHAIALFGKVNHAI